MKIALFGFLLSLQPAFLIANICSNIDSGFASSDISAVINDPGTLDGHTLVLFYGTFSSGVQPGISNKQLNFIGEPYLRNGNNLEAPPVVECFAGGYGLLFDFSTNSQIAGISFNAPTVPPVAAIRLNSSAQISIRDCFFNGNAGIYIFSGNDHLITGNIFLTLADYGVSINADMVNQSFAHKIQFNRFDNCALGISANGDSFINEISRNLFFNGSLGIQVLNFASAHMLHNTFFNLNNTAVFYENGDGSMHNNLFALNAVSVNLMGNNPMFTHVKNGFWQNGNMFLADTSSEIFSLEADPNHITYPGFINRDDSIFVDAGAFIPGVNDSYMGLGPDIGAEESPFVRSFIEYDTFKDRRIAVYNTVVSRKKIEPFVFAVSTGPSFSTEVRASVFNLEGQLVADLGFSPSFDYSAVFQWMYSEALPLGDYYLVANWDKSERDAALITVTE